MPELTYPPKNTRSPFASFRGHHVALRVNDYEQAKHWYVEMLDFRVVREWPWNGFQLAYLAPPGDDDFHVEILGGDSPTPNAPYTNVIESMRESGYHHFCLRVNSVDDALAELRRRGVTVLGEPFDLTEVGSRLALLADPWGNIVELSQPL